MERMTRTRLLTVGVVLVVFGAGVAVGVVVDRSVLAPATAAESEADDRKRRDRDERRLVIDRVEMSGEQRARVDSIVEYHRERMSELWSEFRPRLREVAADTREDIKAVLTPEQRATYDSLLAKRKRDYRDGDDRKKDDPDERDGGAR